MSKHQSDRLDRLVLVDLFDTTTLVALDGRLLYAEDRCDRTCHNTMYTALGIAKRLRDILNTPIVHVTLHGAIQWNEFLDRHDIDSDEIGEWTYDEVMAGALADLQEHDLDHVQTPGSVPE